MGLMERLEQVVGGKDVTAHVEKRAWHTIEVQEKRPTWHLHSWLERNGNR